MKIDQRRLDILNYLLDYRGMNAKQMTAFIYMNSYYTTSNLKQVQRDLKNLTDNGYVTKFLYSESFADEDGVIKKQNVSMYYLTAAGYEYMLNYYDVVPGQQGSGFLLDDDFVYGDIKYETYTPPQKQFDHHLMAVDGFIQMCTLQKKIPHRNNLYAAKRFENKRLRPDAEARINGKLYFFEYDRDTENPEKLVEKFKTYASYFDTLSKDEKFNLGKIIFVVNDSNGKNRRWNNVLAAYLKGIGVYWSLVSLVMCDMSELNEILYYESDSSAVNEDIKNYLEAQHHSNSVWPDFRNKVAFVINDNTIQLTTFIYQYDSTLINRLKIMLTIMDKHKLKLNPTALLISTMSLYKVKLNLKHYNVPEMFIELYEIYEDKLDKNVIRYPAMFLDEVRIDKLFDDLTY